MSYSASRLTIYALISAIEQDLRNILTKHFSGHIDPLLFLGPDLHKACRERQSKDLGFIPTTSELSDLCLYLDFGDTFALINRHPGYLTPDSRKVMKAITADLESLIPIRNRVAHVRPLHYDDLANTLDVSSELTKKKVLPWESLRTTIARLKSDPSFVLGLTIKSIDPTSADQRHNLPLPDFDETGFVGRRREVDEVKKLCLGAYPVISVVGEGGLGKTALALKVAYELLDETPDRFDAIIWSSSKTTQLTASEIRKIQGAISTSLGVLEVIAMQLVGGSSVNDPINEILSYLEQFKLLIILDNLENVLDDKIKFFLQNLPSGSKILITSRVGLGAFEYPFKLDSFSDAEAIQLLRATAKARGVTQLVQISNKDLAKYCSKMHSSPGYIKWFVAAVATGKRPEEVIANPRLFLEFCMSNVYENLESESKHVLKSMLSVPGLHSQAELAFLNNYDVASLQRALQQLLTTNIVIMSTSIDDGIMISKYGIADMPREFLIKHHRPAPQEDAMFAKRQRVLTASTEKLGIEKGSDPLSFSTIKIRSQVSSRVFRGVQGHGYAPC